MSSSHGKLLAWIERRDAATYVAAFVGEGARGHRAPATLACPSPEAARAWVEREASALNLGVEWGPGAQPG